MFSVGSVKPANRPSNGNGIDALSAALIGTGSNTAIESNFGPSEPASALSLPQAVRASPSKTGTIHCSCRISPPGGSTGRMLDGMPWPGRQPVVLVYCAACVADPPLY